MAETGFDRECVSSNPLTPANQSGLCIWPVWIAIIRALRGLWRRVSGLWTPEFLNPEAILPEVSRRFWRYPQIFGDACWRPVRSSTAWSGWQSCRDVRLALSGANTFD